MLHYGADDGSDLGMLHVAPRMILVRDLGEVAGRDDLMVEDGARIVFS